MAVRQKSPRCDKETAVTARSLEFSPPLSYDSSSLFLSDTARLLFARQKRKKSQRLCTREFPLFCFVGKKQQRQKTRSSWLDTLQTPNLFLSTMPPTDIIESNLDSPTWADAVAVPSTPSNSNALPYSSGRWAPDDEQGSGNRNTVAPTILSAELQEWYNILHRCIIVGLVADALVSLGTLLIIVLWQHYERLHPLPVWLQAVMITLAVATLLRAVLTLAGLHLAVGHRGGLQASAWVSMAAAFIALFSAIVAGIEQTSMEQQVCEGYRSSHNKTASNETLAPTPVSMTPTPAPIENALATSRLLLFDQWNDLGNSSNNETEVPHVNHHVFCHDTLHWLWLLLTIVAALEAARYVLLSYYRTKVLLPVDADELVYRSMQGTGRLFTTPRLWWWSQSDLDSGDQRDPLLNGEPEWMHAELDAPSPGWSISSIFRRSGGSITNEDLRARSAGDFAPIEEWASRDQSDPCWWSKDEEDKDNNNGALLDDHWSHGVTSASSLGTPQRRTPALTPYATPSQSNDEGEK